MPPDFHKCWKVGKLNVLPALAWMLFLVGSGGHFSSKPPTLDGQAVGNLGIGQDFKLKNGGGLKAYACLKDLKPAWVPRGVTFSPTAFCARLQKAIPQVKRPDVQSSQHLDAVFSPKAMSLAKCIEISRGGGEVDRAVWCLVLPGILAWSLRRLATCFAGASAPQAAGPTVCLSA